MGSDIVALIKVVEQCDKAFMIGLSSPAPEEQASCTDSNQTSTRLVRLNAPTQSDLCSKRSIASNPQLVSAQNEQATQAVFRSSLPV